MAFCGGLRPKDEGGATATVLVESHDPIDRQVPSTASALLRPAEGILAVELPAAWAS